MAGKPLQQRNAGRICARLSFVPLPFLKHHLDGFGFFQAAIHPIDFAKKIFGQKAIQKLRLGGIPSWNELDTICKLTNSKIEDLVEYLPED